MGKFESAWGEAEPLVIIAEGDTVTIPDAHLLFSGDYSRSGTDLVIAGEAGKSVVVVDYFGDAGQPTLASPTGAVLLPDVVSALAGPRAPGQYAQETDAQPQEGIGRVVTVSGSATAQRSDGTVVDLLVDSRVAQGDVVQTGPSSELGIVFDDGAVFNLNADSRMVLNELVYESGGSSNSMLFSMVQGVFAFVAGQVAPTGEMRIDTPVATMGVRGTSCLGLLDGVAVFRVIPDPVTEHVGSCVLYSRGTDIVLAVSDSLDTQLAFDPATGQMVEQPADPAHDDIIQRLHDTYVRFAGVPTEQQETQQAGEAGGSGIETQFSLAAEPAVIVALDGGALGEFETLSGDEPITEAIVFEPASDLAELLSPSPLIAVAPAAAPQPSPAPPVVSGEATITGTTTGGGTEDGETQTATGSLSVSDPDAGESTVQPLNDIAGNFGTFSITADGLWTYTLNSSDPAVQALGEGETASDSFTVTSADGTASETVTITVTGANDAPVVEALAVSADEDDTSLSTDLLSGASDVEGDVLSVQSVDPAITTLQGRELALGTHYTVIDGVGSLTAQGIALFDSLAEGAEDSFVVNFEVSDGIDATPNSLTVTIHGANDAPVAADDTFSTDENTTINGNVLANDSDPDEDPLTVIRVNGSTANVGTQIALASGALLVLNADGSFAYDPNNQFDSLGAGETDQDSFTYTVSDGNGGTDTATVTLTINGVDAPPVATDSLVATNSGDAASGTLTGAGPGSTIFSLEQGPELGTVEINPDGSFTYTPDVEAFGQDSFTFRVTDGQGEFDTGTVAVDIAGGGEPKNITGTDGNDVLIGSNQFDELRGGLGNDVLRSGGAPTNFSGVDLLVGGPGDDTLIAEGGNVVLVGGEGNDELTSTDEGGDFDRVRADYQASPAGIVANLTAGTIDGLAPGEVADGFGTVDQVSNIHIIADSEHNDIFNIDASYTNSLGNLIEVRLSGGDDTVTFTNVDVARISYQQALGPVIVDLEDGTASDIDPLDNFIGDDTFSGATSARGSQFDDVLLGRVDGNDEFRGNGGDDFIDGRGGNDRITFRSSDSSIHVDLSQNLVLDDGLGGVDTLVSIEQVTGSGFDDLIIGDAGNNRLEGARGDDTLIGGLGNDNLIGGVGLDRFAYDSPGEGIDNIIDFTLGEDLLVIDVAGFGGGLDAGAGLSESQFVAGAPPQASGELGQFLYDTSSGDLFWDGDGGGDQQAVQLATLTGAPSLAASDFELVDSGGGFVALSQITAAVEGGGDHVAS